MAIDPVTGLPYPSSGDAPDGAAAIQALVSALAGASGNATPVLRAADAADRDAKYGGTLTPVGVLVVASTAPTTAWIKVNTTGLAAADWKIWWQGKQSWTPIITRGDTGATVSSSPTTGASYWHIFGGVAHVHGEVVLNADALGGCVISLPIAAPQRYFGIGVCGLWGSGTPADQSGVAWMYDTSHLVTVRYTNGYLDGASGQQVRFTVSYSTV